MGNIIASKSKSCGFSNEFSFGGGRYSYQTYCPVPAINKETLEFENINYLEHKNTNKYLFYSDDILKGNNYDNNIINNFDLKLNTVNNYCPNCKEKAFAFHITMFVD
ncbi:hypothetical protein [Flavobacterium macacae]|uniref:Uncharacterized protein n=1 Tax=Flavobacterium macacae TaxID=2488993 RepID=A0A3P3WDM2_9FLAO|nr:hypothetical protein [Flavobacterium macacae]RRJ92467.1 hypothetical protein EG849_05650 [Flavobacterium macacae]